MTPEDKIAILEAQLAEALRERDDARQKLHAVFDYIQSLKKKPPKQRVDNAG